MTMQAVQGCMYWPPMFQAGGVAANLGFSIAATMDAATEKFAAFGNVWWDGAPGSAKTFGTSSKIHFRTVTVTFADAATNVRIGLQDFVTTGLTAGPQPDGTFDVYADVGGTSGLITSSDDNVAKSITMTTGSKSIAHGDPVAVVFDMTARGGSDSLQIAGFSSGTTARPTYATYVGSWGNFTSMPMLLLEADDGTFGIFRGQGLFLSNGSTTYVYQASTNPDERGLVFQVPFRCKVSGVVAAVTNGASSAGDATIRIYSDPLGTPTSMASTSYIGDEHINSTRLAHFHFAEVTLEANTDYCIAVEATGTANITFGYVTLASANHRPVMGLSNCRAGSRNNLTGAFSETTTEIPLIGVMISAIDDGFGGGRASFNLGL